MAQYYQIAVGQGHQLTLEDLQRYCPNICLDGRIVVNQEDQQYGQQVVVQPADQGNDIIVSEGVQVQPQLVVSEGLQYQQQYIIRHDQPPSVQPSPQPNRPDFHQQSQGHQQQTLLRHQVYYTDLPVDAQVVLQHAPQIVDASLMQQSSTPRSQHLVNPVHVLSSPTVLHPSQQPPPQPPPPTPIPPPQHTPQSQSQQQPQQQMSRASPQLLQQLQHHQIQFQQLQQQQQQQIQQQQQLQHQLQQQQQQQQQHQTHHLQSQQIQHQQVMQTAYINQAGTPTRPPPQRLLNQALSNNGVTLVRTPVRTMRPRRPVVRNAISPAPPLQVPTRLLNPQLLQQNPSGSSPVGTTVRATMSPGPTRVRTARPASPRVLNSHAVHSQHRPPRPRTPLLQQQQQQQQQHQQQQLAQHLLGQQVQQQQLNQLKLSQQQQQIIINQNQHGQSARIITPQGTIVTQCLNQTSLQSHQNNGSLTNVATQQLQQIQQIKKVVVTPNNANEMDDLEESITAAIVQKNIANDNMNAQFQTSPIRQTTSVSQPMNSHQINYPQHGFQQDNVLRIYESPHVQQPHVNQQHQVMMEQDTDPEERQLVTLSSGHRITIAEYKRLQSSRVLSQQHLHLQQQQPRETARQTLVKSKEQQRPVQRVHPMQTQPPTPISENNEAVSGPSEQTAEPQSAKMLIFLQNGEQRLITFTLPKESCTLQEVLEQVNVPFTEETHIQCMQNTSSEIDYFVSVGSTTRIEEMLENHPMLVGDIASRSSPSVGPQSQSSEMSTPEKVHPESTSSSPESPKSPPPRFVDGKLAVCKSCGYSGCDFNRCQRCKRVFTEEPKSVSIPNKSIEQKKKEGEKSTLDKQMPCADGIKINLLKQTVKNLNNKTAAQDKGKPRVRKPRGKQPDPEPVILTLSSDEEDSDSSMLSNQMDQNLHSKEPSLLEIEGPDSGIGFDLIDESREEISQNMTNIGTSFKCRTIRIGSYRYTPKEKIFISPRGIKIVAPTLKNESKEVALQIQIKDIVRILVHFGKGLPVIFLYTTSKCGLYIRKLLEMTDEQGPYYNPSSKVDPYKRITLLPDAISDELKTSFQTLYGSILVDLTTKEANEILVRTCPKENSICKVTTRSASASSNSGVKSVNTSEQIRQILIYPPGKGGIPINTEDYMCLAQDQFLNDVIIDFYLKYLVHDKLTASQREKTHIFSTFFYKRLTTKPSKVNKSSNPLEWDNSLTPAQKRHARVKTWTKNVNIFDKDFIVVPINENCHWFVAIICFPSLEGCRSMIDNRIVIPQATKRRERKSSMQIGNTTITPLSKQEQLTLNCDSDNLSERDEAEAEESDLDMQCDSEEDESEKPVEKKMEVPVVRKNEPIKQPCILIFDSLAGASRSRVVATLRDYLTCEYQTKISKNKVFNKDNIKGSCPKIPQQNNFTDCGLYLLQYVEQFFKDPVMDYSLPIKQLANWFDEIIVTRKREEISILLKALMNTYNPDSHLNLPDIAFPTLNGKLIETEEHADDGSGSEKSSSSKEQKCDVRSGDGSTITFVKQMATGDILVKRNFADSTETLHLRKAIRLSSESENRSVIPFKQNLIKKGDHDNQVLILRSGDLVKEIQNTLIVNKNKTVGEKKHGVHNQNVSVNCVRQSVSDSDNTFHKTRRINKMEDVMHESVKKFKKNEC